MTVRVFVPLVGADGTAEQVFEAIAGDTAPEPHPARLVPQISDLHDFGLYQIGVVVREAVARTVESRRGRVWLGRRNARARRWYLRISELQIGRLSDQNARSAGVGLALAALLEAFGCHDAGVIFATGEIVLDGGPGTPAVRIGAVDGIRGKLMLVGNYIAQHRGNFQDAVISVVLPHLSVDGRPLEQVEARMLERLKAEAVSAGARLTLVFAQTLDDLEPPFGPFALREVVTRRRAVAGTAAAALVAALAVGWFAGRGAGVQIAFAPVPASIAASLTDNGPVPRRARYDGARDVWTLLPLCFDAQRTPIVVGGELLLLFLSVQDGLRFASWVQPYRLFIGAVSTAADPMLLPESTFGRVGTAGGGGGAASFIAIPIEPVDDTIRLFVLASRNPDLEVAKVLDELRLHLAGQTGQAALSATAGFFSDRFDGQVDFQFKVTSDASACPN